MCCVCVVCVLCVCCVCVVCVLCVCCVCVVCVLCVLCVCCVYVSMSERKIFSLFQHLRISVHPAVMGTWNFLECKITLIMACQSVKGSGGTLGAHTH